MACRAAGASSMSAFSTFPEMNGKEDLELPITIPAMLSYICGVEIVLNLRFTALKNDMMYFWVAPVSRFNFLNS